jgi:DNA (cytosine-5)-methyltransferase 1
VSINTISETNTKTCLNNGLKAVDFFCGGGGMSYGMLQAGVNVIAGIDYEPKCKETYEANITGARFIEADVFELEETYLEEELKIQKNDDNLILIGCSPCQFWSIINTEKTKSEKSKNLLKEFSKFVKYYNPGYVVVENVPGVLRKKEESGLQEFIEWLKENDYTVHFNVHNVSDFGVPQSRKRFTLIANRVTTAEIQPIKSIGKKLTVRDVLGVENGFPEIAAGTRDQSDFLHTVMKLGEINQERLMYVQKDGGDRFGFAGFKHLQLKCFEGRENSFKDTFGRLWWDRPSPTITTKFYNISNGRFVHPEENRALSLREGAVLQSFPKNYKFLGTGLDSIARIIGNAVPPQYAKSIGLAITQNLNGAIQN